MPLDRYEALRHAAEATPTPSSTPKPGAPWALERAELALALSPASARLETRLSVRVLADGWQAIQLPPAGRLLDADLGSLRGRMEQDQKAWKMHVAGPGAAVVRLTSVVPIERDGRAARPTWTLTLPLPNAAAVRLKADLPESIEALEVASGGVILARAGKTVSILGKPGGSLRLLLLGRSETGPAQEDRLFVTASTCSLVRPSASRTRVTAWILARRLSGRLQSLEARVPGDLTVVSVEGDVSAWQVENGTLHIVPTDPEASEAVWEIHLTAPPATDLVTPILVPTVDSLRMVAAAVQAEDDAFVEITDPGSGHLASPSEWADLIPAFRAATSTAVMLSDAGRPPRWSITRSQGAQVLAAQVDRLVVDAVIGDGTSMAYQCWASVRSSGATLLTLTLPPGARLLEASRNGIPLIPGMGGDGVLLPIAAQEEAQVLHVAAILPQPAVPERGSFTLPLPAASAPITRVAVRAVLPPDLEASPPPGRGSRSAFSPPSSPPLSRLAGESADLLTRIAGVPTVLARRSQGFFSAPPGFHELWASWETLSQTPGSLQLEIERVSPRKEWF